MYQFRIFPDSEALAASAVEEFIRLAVQSIQDRGRFSVALSGGTTPKALYRILADTDYQARLDWGHIHLFFGDERYVGSDHPESNYYMVKETLLEKINIPEGNIHPVPTDLDVHQAALTYEAMLQECFDGDWPRFDLVLLGMGADGHTASLFPHSSGLEEENHWFIANYAPKPGAWRMTLTKYAINFARNILVLVSGGSKAKMVEKVFYGPVKLSELPIQMIAPHDGQMTWMLDRDAAQYLNNV